MCFIQISWSPSFVFIAGLFPLVPYSHCLILTFSFPFFLSLCSYLSLHLCREKIHSHDSAPLCIIMFFLNYQPPPDLRNTCLIHTRTHKSTHTPDTAYPCSDTYNQSKYISLNSILFPHGLPLINVMGEHFDLST